MEFLRFIGGIVSFLIGLYVLIKLFQKEGVLKGILGLICMLYTFVWGWQHAKEENMTTFMWIWTGIVILSVILGLLIQPAAPAEGLRFLPLI
jgi:hypothetical protein